MERLWDPNRVKIEVYNRLTTRFEHRLLDLLVEDEVLRDELVLVDLAEQERALLWKEGRLASVLGRGRHAFWRKPYELEVERFNVRDFRFQHPKLESILARSLAGEYLESVRVRTYERVLLFLEGRLVEVLEPGLHAFWKQAGKIEFWTADLREQVAEVAGQEIMTADKVTLRVNLLVTYAFSAGQPAGDLPGSQCDAGPDRGHQLRAGRLPRGPAGASGGSGNSSDR